MSTQLLVILATVFGIIAKNILKLAFFGIINAIIASRKGFNPLIWFFAAGLLGLIVLFFLPSATKAMAYDPELSEERKRAGNNAGLIIIGIAIFLMFIFLIV
jgi:hypothetical protein